MGSGFWRKYSARARRYDTPPRSLIDCMCLSLSKVSDFRAVTGGRPSRLASCLGAGVPPPRFSGNHALLRATISGASTVTVTDCPRGLRFAGNGSPRSG